MIVSWGKGSSFGTTPNDRRGCARTVRESAWYADLSLQVAKRITRRPHFFSFATIFSRWGSILIR